MTTKKVEEERGLIVPTFAVMKYTATQLGDIIKRNVGSGQLSQGDLDRVRVPAGGGTTWEIPAIDGTRDSKVIEGVVVAWADVRAFWMEKYDGGRTPPDCSSDDAETGVGKPGGSCGVCPNAQFGTAVNDKGELTDGQACRLMRVMAILQKDDLVPIILVAPPTSVGELRKYFLRLASRALAFCDVVTELTLTATVSKTGMKHSVVSPAVAEQLDDEARARIAPYVETFGRSLGRGTSRKYAE
jgi:hypothetical protein